MCKSLHQQCLAIPGISCGCSLQSFQLLSQVVLFTLAKTLHSIGVTLRVLVCLVQRPIQGRPWPCSLLEDLKVPGWWILRSLPGWTRAHVPVAPAVLLQHQISCSAGSHCAPSQQGWWSCLWEGRGCSSISKCISLFICPMGRNSRSLGCFLPDPSLLPQCCPSKGVTFQLFFSLWNSLSCFSFWFCDLPCSAIFWFLTLFLVHYWQPVQDKENI